MLAVLSAALYGAYTVVMRLKMPGEEAEAHVALFFGYVGLFSTVRTQRCRAALLGSAAEQPGC